MTTRRSPLLGLAALTIAATAAAQTLTITNATVVDVTTGTLQRGATVVVDGNRITSVGLSFARPARGQVVDAKGMYVIPGLWDMHTHAYFGWPTDFGDSYVLLLFIANGITGVRDMASDLDAILRARAGQRTFEHLIGIFEASTPDETMFLSRRYGAGKDSAHNKFLATLLDRYDANREASIIALLAKNIVWQCPTLFWERGQWLVDVIDFTKDADVAFTPRTWIETKYPSSAKSIAASMDRDPLEVRRRFVEHELEIVRKPNAAGVPFLAGTDTPAGVEVTPGISLHLELQRFVAAGFTPLQALQTATINPARFLRKTSDFGTVQPGRIADLVILRANPLADIGNTRAIAGVVADGKYWSSSEVEALRDKLKTVAASR